MSEQITERAESIPVRRPELVFDARIERYYLGGNPVATHFFNALNLLFPDGERFFVKSVRDHMAQIEDPQLLADIKGFFGQEGQHAHQHERFFTTLEGQGYDLEPVLRRFKPFARWSNRWVPRALRLAITAGAEHYTATMATLGLHYDMVGQCDPTMRKLIVWHAIEEIEHKHVAYDVLQSVHPYNYPLRVFGFLAASLVIAVWTFAGLRVLLGQDFRARRLTRGGFDQARDALSDGKHARFRGAVRKLLLQYLRPGFHPREIRDAGVKAQFLPELAQVV